MVATLTQILSIPAPAGRAVEVSASPASGGRQPASKGADTKGPDPTDPKYSAKGEPGPSREPRASRPDGNKGEKAGKARPQAGKHGGRKTMQAPGLPPAISGEIDQPAPAATTPFAALVAEKLGEEPVAAKLAAEAVEAIQPAVATPTGAEAAPVDPVQNAAETRAIPSVKVVAAEADAPAAPAAEATAPEIAPAPSPAAAKVEASSGEEPADTTARVQQLPAQAPAKPVEADQAAPRAAEAPNAAPTAPPVVQASPVPEAGVAPETRDAEGKVDGVRASGEQRDQRSSAALRLQAVMTEQTGAKGVEVPLQNDSPTAAAQVGRVDPSPVDGQAGVTASAPPAEAAPREAVASQVAEQIQANADRLNQQIEIRLHPPELGTVKLTLKADGSDIRGEMKVSNPDTAAQLQIESPGLFRRLADGGIQMRRLDISLDNGSAGNQDGSLLGDPQGRDGQFAGGRGGFAPAPTPTASAYGAGSAAAGPAAYVTDQSINVWM